MIHVNYHDKNLRTVTFSKKSLSKIKGPVWIDLQDATEEEFEQLADIFKLHPLTVEDLRYKMTRVKIEEFPKYLLVVLKTVALDGTIKLTELDFIIGKNFLITNHHGDRISIKQLMEDKQRLTHLMKRGLDFIMHRLVDVEVDNYLPIIEHFEEKIDKLDAEAIKSPRQDLFKRISLVQRQLGEIKKTMFSEREAIGILSRREYKYISQGVEAYFRDVYDHALHISDKIDSQRDATTGAYQAYMSSLSNNMNEVMKVLSIIATVMLPLTFVTGVYGMNFTVLPGSKHPFGFWVIMAFMTLLGIVMLAFFKKRKWF
ncbi:MAG: magnesium/cobalt transporter CorA [Candidatus Nanoarchaeia archaeon]